MSDPLIGRVLDDRDTLLTPLGEGGMGAVYVARLCADRACDSRPSAKTLGYRDQVVTLYSICRKHR